MTVIHYLQLSRSWTSVFEQDSTQDFLTASEFPECNYSPCKGESRLFPKAVCCHTQNSPRNLALPLDHASLVDTKQRSGSN